MQSVRPPSFRHRIRLCHDGSHVTTLAVQIAHPSVLTQRWTSTSSLCCIFLWGPAAYCSTVLGCLSWLPLGGVVSLPLGILQTEHTHLSSEVGSSTSMSLVRSCSPPPRSLGPWQQCARTSFGPNMKTQDGELCSYSVVGHVARGLPISFHV